MTGKHPLSDSSGQVANRGTIAGRAIFQMVATAIATAFILKVQPANHLSYIWPLTGLQLALAWEDWPCSDRRILQLLAAVTGYVAACLWSGWPRSLAVEMSAIQGAELWIMLIILRPRIARFVDLKRLRLVCLFGIVSLAIPLVTAGVRAVVFSKAIHASMLQAWLITGMSHSVGLMVVTPPLLFLHACGHAHPTPVWTKWKVGLAAQLLVLVVSLYVFNQTTYPLLFMVLPPVVLAVLVGGLEGATIASLNVAIIACAASAAHHGPVWMIPGIRNESRTTILQLFLAMVVGKVFPVGALLDERDAADKEIRKGQSIYHTLLDHSQDMILLSSLDGSTRYVSPGVKAISGWTPEEFVTRPPLETMHEEDRPIALGIIASLRKGETERSFRYRLRCKDGRYLWVEASMLGYGDGSNTPLLGYVATMRDVSVQMKREQEWLAERDELAQENKSLTVLAGNDELTGIANRRTFNRLLAHEVNRHKRTNTCLSLIMCDVDFFKKYNDRYGHPMGDEVLKQVAMVLVNSSRASDLPARVGGEEFALLLPDTDTAGSLRVAVRILAGLRELHIPHEDSPFGSITMSIGSTTWGGDDTCDEAQLVRQADQSLYESKTSGRNKVTSSQTSHPETVPVVG